MALVQAASRDELHTEEQLRAQAGRMLADGRARRVFWSFPRQWLGLDRILLDEHAVRTPVVDPQWTVASQASASQETELFIENTLVGGGHLADLLTSPRAWVDAEMARIYGLPVPARPSATWNEVTLPMNERAGVLTRASFLAGYSHRGGTSPPVRGQRDSAPPPLPASRVAAAGRRPVAADRRSGQGPQTNRMLFETRTGPRDVPEVPRRA